MKNLLGGIALLLGISSLVVHFMGGDGTWLMDKALEFTAYTVIWCFVISIPMMIILSILKR